MILIDMEMPEKCGLCPLFHAEYPMHCQGVKADRKKKIVSPYGQPRPDWCPLHEVTAETYFLHNHDKKGTGFFSLDM